MKRLAVILVMSLLVPLAMVAVGSVPATAQGPSQGGFTSDNVEYVGFVPFDQSTSTGVSIFGQYMYLTSWKNISIYDISDPLNPVQTAVLPVGFMFENEDVGVDPKQSFLLFSESLPMDALHVYDIEDKTNIVEIASLAGAGDHTTSCILKCTFAYGSDGTIVDLRDPANPKFVAERTAENSWHKQTGIGPSGAHDVREFKNGFVIVSPIDDPLQILDVRDPAHPKVVARGEHPNNAGYLFHSGVWPNQGNDRWLIMQGEENVNPRCDPEANGPILTYDTTGWEKTQTMKLVDHYAVQNGTFTDGNPPANGLGCSAHWFEEHPTFDNGGLLAVGYYEHGTRFLNVSPKGKLTDPGYFLPFSGSTSAAYWVTENPKDNLVYAVDYVRGIDILRYTGPEIKPQPGGGGGGGGEEPGQGGGNAQDKRPFVRMKTTPSRPPRGGRVTFTITMRACRSGLNPAGTTIELKRHKGRKFVTVATKKFDRSCSEVFRQKANFKQAEFRAVWPKQKKGYSAGRSEDETVRTRG